MKRSDLIGAAGLGILASAFHVSAATASTLPNGGKMLQNLGKLVRLPAHGPLEVAFLVGPETVLIDVAGPMEAMYDAMMPIHAYTVAPSMSGNKLGDIKIVPDYTFANAPKPNVIVVPATKNLPESVAWVKKMSAHADITMSVCTGAYLLAKTGLLDGQYATTHHSAYDDFARQFPKVKLLRGPRYVENRDVASSGGETSGIDLALRVVERYFGKKAADTSAEGMEHLRTPRPWV